MGKNESTTTDLTRGYYRRQYAGFVRGRRINQLSLNAEAWFWRVHSAADDFGNLDGEPTLVFAATVGRRKNVTLEDVTAFVGEMLSAELVRAYEADGEKYLHVVEFTERQPAGKNGRRVRRFPQSPWDSPEPRSGDSGGIPVNPSEVSAHYDYDQDYDHSQDQNPAAQGSGVPASQAPPPPDDPIVLKFPCCAGRKGGPKEWELKQSYLDELRETFDFDVLFECRKALAWVRAKSSNRKTSDGMKSFLVGWMGRVQNRGSGRNGTGATRPQSRDELRMAAVEKGLESL